MKKTIYFCVALHFSPFMLFAVEEPAVQSGGDMLNEVPIWPVPAEMTLEEYKDANRRLSVGRALMAVPFPGALHFYAGERKAGWKHVYAAGIGVASMIVGAVMIDEKDNAWEETDFEIIDITGKSGKVERYEKIPVEEEDGAVNYRLEGLRRKSTGAGGAFIVLGAGLVVGQLVHDWIGGIKTIERKRDAVRYKYGKSAGYRVSMSPTMNIERGSLGAQLSLRF
ncbi:MAG: hypothetical protein VX733_01340 [Candidatus Latescibacterota bacterium]|nr:hypothetical protein [Candidatus Latescibacterota bacterium]